jgi:hypothetical protein
MALILGVDRFMSECRSLTNFIGNAVATVVVRAGKTRWTLRAWMPRSTAACRPCPQWPRLPLPKYPQSPQLAAV